MSPYKRLIMIGNQRDIRGVEVTVGMVVVVVGLVAPVMVGIHTAVHHGLVAMVVVVVVKVVALRRLRRRRLRRRRRRRLLRRAQTRMVRVHRLDVASK